jgi:hypothetical protein
MAVTCKKCGGRIVLDRASTQTAKMTAGDRHPPVPPTSQASPAQPAEVLNVYPQLTGLSPRTFALTEILTPNKKGNFKTGQNTFKAKILCTVKDVVENMLRKDEVVMRIAAGTAYFPVEIFFGNGWLTMLYNRYALIATNQRLLMINTNHRMTKPAHYVYQMPYSNIKKVERGLFRRNIVLVPKKGKRKIFTSMTAYLSAEMSKFIRNHIDSATPVGTPASILTDLCPACFAVLEKSLSNCTTCAAEFKTPKKAMLKSLVLPGWGDIYLGHRLLGLIEVLGSLFIWLIFFGLLMSGLAQDLIIGLFLLVFYNGADSLLTYYMARKGYILERKQSMQPTADRLAQSSA